MNNDFEYQSNCLINVNIKSEPNEENTEDMSEDIDNERDERMNIGRVVTTIDKTKTLPKRDYSRVIKVVKVPTVQHKNNESEPSVERVAVSGQTIGKPIFIKVLKCSVKSCTTFCLDETALKKHLETDHKSGIVDNVKNKGDEDMSEDIDKEGDELMSGDELNREDNNQSTEEPNIGQNKSSVELLAQSGDAAKSKLLLLSNPKNKPLIERVSVGSDQTAKESMVKCIIVGCNTQCRDQRGLERHLEVSHKLMYIKGPKQASSVKSERPEFVPSLSSLSSAHEINVLPVLDKFKTSIGKGCNLERQTKEVILNLKQYFDALFGDEQNVVDIIKLATKISTVSIYKTIREFKETGTLRKPIDKTKAIKPLRYKYSDEDRDILSRVVYKLRDENRLRGYKSVFDEIKTSKEFNPTFKKCGIKGFGDLFKRFGFRISDNKIIDIKPSDSERERMACKRSEDSKLLCDWPGCLKQFKNSQHLIRHLRTHTNVKPYVCRFPKCDYRCAVYGNFNKHLKCHNKTVFPDDDESEEFI